MNEGNLKQDLAENSSTQKKNSFPIIFLIICALFALGPIAILIIIAIIGFASFTNIEEINEEVVETVEEFSSDIDTSAWTTYKSFQYDFSFQYENEITETDSTSPELFVINTDYNPNYHLMWIVFSGDESDYEDDIDVSKTAEGFVELTENITYGDKTGTLLEFEGASDDFGATYASIEFLYRDNDEYYHKVIINNEEMELGDDLKELLEAALTTSD